MDTMTYEKVLLGGRTFIYCIIFDIWRDSHGVLRGVALLNDTEIGVLKRPLDAFWWLEIPL